MNVSAAAGLSLVALAALLGLASALYEEDVDYLLAPEDDAEEPITTEKRFYMGMSCRRCLHNPNDYGACMQCYSRPGSPTPYFGMKKRAFDDQFAFLPDEYDSYSHMSKRSSFMACKCCLSLGRNTCCERCGFRPGKRGYTTSFVGMDSMSSCSCCSAAMFDFGCCLRCHKRK